MSKKNTSIKIFLRLLQKGILIAFAALLAIGTAVPFPALAEDDVPQDNVSDPAYYTQVAKLDPQDGSDGDKFGENMAVDGSTLVIGAQFLGDGVEFESGAAYVFEEGAGWGDGHANQVARLDPTDNAPNDFFGSAVAIDGDTIVVGARSTGSNSGAVYVFEKGGGWADGDANQVAKLVAPTLPTAPAAEGASDEDSNDWFGAAVAIDGDTIVVGAYGDEGPAPGYVAMGSVYVYEKGAGWTDGTGNLVAKLNPPNGAADDAFGIAVAISGDTIITGANKNDDYNGINSGAAYVFEKGGGWTDGFGNLSAELYPHEDDGNNYDQFGEAIDIEGDTVVIGSRLFNNGGTEDTGAVFVYEKGAGWADGDANQVAQLIPYDNDLGDEFGSAVDLNGDLLAVGAQGDQKPVNTSYSGSAYVFKKGAGWADGDANQLSKYYPDDKEKNEEDYFGVSVAITNDYAFGGAFVDGDPNGENAGSAYVFGIPEIRIRGNGVTIVDGDTTPSLTDHTDFENVKIDGMTSTRTYTIKNLGNAELRITLPISITGTHKADFTVTTPPDETIAPGDTTTFDVTFDPSAVGIRTATISITNNDPDENPYDYAIQGNGTSVVGSVLADFDGDGDTDVSVYVPATGNWNIYGQGTTFWGVPGDLPVPGDYNGDGTVDIAVYRPSNGNWYIAGSGKISWGLVGDIPVPGDYDGDGDCDIAVFRPSNGRWYIKDQFSLSWAVVGDIPVPADYNGDGITDLAVYRPSNGNWYIAGMGNFSWGLAGDIPVPGDYDGDGDYDIAVFRPSIGKWYVRDGVNVNWGFAGNYPLPARDTNADGDPHH